MPKLKTHSGAKKRFKMSKKGKIKNFKQLIKCLQPNRRAVIEVTGTRVAK